MIRLMELTMNQANMNLGNANAEWGSTGWRMPEFGFQKYVAEAVKSIFHTIHSSFDYHSKATIRELLVFLVYAVVLQGVLIPTESYTTLHADASMMAAAGLADLVVCIIPGVALVWRWIKSHSKLQ